jgi:hypothetical protein
MASLSPNLEPIAPKITKYEEEPNWNIAWLKHHFLEFEIEDVIDNL